MSAKVGFSKRLAAIRLPGHRKARQPMPQGGASGQSPQVGSGQGPQVPADPAAAMLALPVSRSAPHFGTRLAERGAGAFEIAGLMGHQDLRMTKRYTHATSRSLQLAVESLDQEIPKRFPTKVITEERRKVG